MEPKVTGLPLTLPLTLPPRPNVQESDYQTEPVRVLSERVWKRLETCAVECSRVSLRALIIKKRANAPEGMAVSQGRFFGTFVIVQKGTQGSRGRYAPYQIERIHLILK
jgi:hypothetical protein